MVEAVIFDFFDVIHSDPYRRWRNKYSLKDQGAIAEANRAVDLGEISEKQFYQRLAEASGQTFDQVQDVFGNKSLIDSDVVGLVRRFKKKYKVGLLSNASGEYLRELLDIHSLSELFDVVAVSGELQLAKPDPEIFEHILHKLGVRANKAVFIDDARRNVSAAERLGIKSILFSNFEQLQTELNEIIEI